jgi:hypothetical protein
MTHVEKPSAPKTLSALLFFLFKEGIGHSKGV